MGGVIGGAIDAIDELTKRQKAVLKLIATNTTISRDNLSYEIRKEIYLFLKNNDKNNNFEGFYKFIKNKYSEENIIKIPEQKIA